MDTAERISFFKLAISQYAAYFTRSCARAVNVEVAAESILVDGRHRIVGCRISQTAVVDADALSASIAAASIVAKVTRDSIMEGYARLYPEYGFERHKGYGTVDHIRVLTRLGPLPLHRWSFAPVWKAGSQPQLALWAD
jgi:ribonuclease HII